MASKATPTPPCPHLPLPSASGQQQIGTALKPELSLWVADFLQFLPTSNSTKRSNSTQSENFSRFSQLFTPLWVTCGLQGLAEVFIKNSIQRQGTILILALEWRSNATSWLYALNCSSVAGSCPTTIWVRSSHWRSCCSSLSFGAALLLGEVF